MDSARLKVAQFRTAVKDILPYFVNYAYGMLATAKPGIGTMAVDEQARLYYDPAFVERCDIKAGRFVICHEGMHVALGHAPMARRVLGDRPTPVQLRAWNLSADCVVNQILSPWLHEAPSPEILGGQLVTHTALGLPPGLTVTAYYDLLMQQHEQEQQRRNDPSHRDEGNDDDDEQENDDESEVDGDAGAGGDGEPEAEGDGGADESGDDEHDDSGSDAGGGDGEPGEGERDPGVGGEEGDADGSGGGDRSPSDGGEDQGDGEDDADSEADGEGRGGVGGGGADGERGEEPDGWPQYASGGSGADGAAREYEDEADAGWKDRNHSLTDMLESRIGEAETAAPGSVPGVLKDAVGLRLRPQADPFDVLRATVSRAVASPVGAPDYTLRKLSRRQQHDGPRLRGVKRETPNAVIILDTSGSMHGERVARAMDVIAKAVRRLQSVRVVCFDAAMHAKKMVTSMGSFQWEGGGGTDMGKAIAEVEKEYRPDAIVLVTDLATPWPQRQPRARVVVAAVEAEPYWLERVPGWVKLCDVSKGGSR